MASPFPAPLVIRGGTVMDGTGGAPFDSTHSISLAPWKAAAARIRLESMKQPSPKRNWRMIAVLSAWKV